MGIITIFFVNLNSSKRWRSLLWDCKNEELIPSDWELLGSVVDPGSKLPGIRAGTLWGAGRRRCPRSIWPICTAGHGSSGSQKTESPDTRTSRTHSRWWRKSLPDERNSRPIYWWIQSVRGFSATLSHSTINRGGGVKPDTHGNVTHYSNSIIDRWWSAIGKFRLRRLFQIPTGKSFNIIWNIDIYPVWLQAVQLNQSKRNK